jgi:hypothetical protein
LGAIMPNYQPIWPLGDFRLPLMKTTYIRFWSVSHHSRRFGCLAPRNPTDPRGNLQVHTFNIRFKLRTSKTQC